MRAWSQAYRDDGLLVVGVHTPEFSFEHDIDGVRQAVEVRDIAVKTILGRYAALGRPEVLRLITIPGVDATVALSIVAAVGDFTRFRTPERLVS